MRAPLRVSLAGGGTDLQSYYAKYGGAVVSTTIDKYFYVVVSNADCDSIEISSSDYRAFYRESFNGLPPWDANLKLLTAIVHHFGTRAGLSVFVASQTPPSTGLGSSGAVAVALIKAMSIIRGQLMTTAEVAELACSIEIDKLRMPVGKQDQYAAAFGGLNYIEFRSDGVTVEPLEMPGDSRLQLQKRLLLFFTGRCRDSTAILREQKRSTERNRASVIKALHAIRESAIALRAELLNGNVAAVGDWLHASWMHKRNLAHGISDPWIDDWYRRAHSTGAKGGILSGAGGGGFLLLYCEPEGQERLTRTLDASGLTRMDFRFESSGAMVVANNLVGASDPAGGNVA
jgi:D-glycero-alpha-D-manno-heptose-7-phosphate kinase